MRTIQQQCRQYLPNSTEELKGICKGLVTGFVLPVAAVLFYMPACHIGETWCYALHSPFLLSPDHMCALQDVGTVFVQNGHIPQGP